MPKSDLRPEDRLWDSLMEAFAELPDPRIDRNKEHKLMDILVIALCGVIAGCEACTQLAAFGRQHEAWLRTFLELPGGIPSHDTFSRVLRLLDAKAFERCFLGWAAAWQRGGGDKRVAVDGKSLRGSGEEPWAPLMLVSAWATESGLALGQTAVDPLSNETMAIPALLKLLDLAGTTVTIDAAGCQRAIATAIREQKADYVLTVKNNQPQLHEEIQAHFQAWELTGLPQESPYHHATQEKGHGRYESRRCWTVPVPPTLRQRTWWRDLQTIGLIESRRIVDDRLEQEQRYFITSLPCDAKRLAEAVRSHWAIENSLHWVLDVTFDEDHCRVRKGHGAANLGGLRRMAVSLLRKAPGRESIATKRLLAAWDVHYLAQVLHSGGN